MHLVTLPALCFLYVFLHMYIFLKLRPAGAVSFAGRQSKVRKCIHFHNLANVSRHFSRQRMYILLLSYIPLPLLRFGGVRCKLSCSPHGCLGVSACLCIGLADRLIVWPACHPLGCWCGNASQRCNALPPFCRTGSRSGHCTRYTGMMRHAHAFRIHPEWCGQPCAPHRHCPADSVCARIPPNG